MLFRSGRGTLALLEPGVAVTLAAEAPALLMLLGGAPLGPRHMFWNFVASRRERIDAARADWEAHGDPARWQGARPDSAFPPVPGEQEFIPLPPKDDTCSCNECPYMRLNTLEKVYLALRDLQPRIELPEDLRQKALRPLERMLAL